MRSKKVLALDFDGLLIDALNECVLVSWNAYHGKSLEHFGEEGLARIPPEFFEKFRNHRGFAKHLGHFLMPLQASAGFFETQAEFDVAYAALDPRQAERFVARVNDYRSAVRQAFRARWLACHTFYPGLERMLQTSTSPLCIVTAKDSGSVQELLHHAGVRIPEARIHGECRDKVRVLKAISGTFAVPPQDVYFFDDNVLNARDALGAGFRSHWALWGYHAPEHFTIAQAAGLPAVELEDLIRAGTEAAT